MEKSSAEVWTTAFTDAGAYWRHDGNPKRPHAILRSVKHSNGYLDCSKIICRPKLLTAAGRALLHQIKLKAAPDWVFGSAFGSILVAYQLAKLLQCRFGFTERPTTGPLSLKRFDIPLDEHALVVATTLPANGAVEATVAALKNMGRAVIPKIVALVNLGSLTTFKGYSIIVPGFQQVSPWLPNAANPTDPCKELASYPASLEQACRLLVPQLKGERVQWVVGAGTDAIAMAYELASLLGCCAAFTEPETTGDLALSHFRLEPAAHALVCEDVLTTGGTTAATIAALENGRAKVLEFLCTIANRSGCANLGPCEIVSLVQPSFNVWPPDACPLCQQGSPAVRPKGNWHLLTKPY